MWSAALFSQRWKIASLESCCMDDSEREETREGKKKTGYFLDTLFREEIPPRRGWINKMERKEQKKKKERRNESLINRRDVEIWENEHGFVPLGWFCQIWIDEGWIMENFLRVNKGWKLWWFENILLEGENESLLNIFSMRKIKEFYC